jgi:hypothetical protein
MRRVLRVAAIEHRANGADRAIEALGDLAIGALEPARFHQRAVEFIREAGAIGAERLDPRRQLVLVPISLPPPLDALSSASSAVIRRRVAASRSAAPGST